MQHGVGNYTRFMTTLLFKGDNFSKTDVRLAGKAG